MWDSPFIQLTAIVFLGVSAQWFAWRLRLPSILLLLTFGILAGPGVNWLDPEDLFPNALAPIISMSVALILFEGGLTLKVADLPKIGGVVRNLVTVGAALGWIVSSVAAYCIFDMSVEVAALTGAVLVVTGPTVVAPLLRHIRPVGSVGPALRWEGIVIDPIGAVLTVLVFGVITLDTHDNAVTHVAVGLLKTLVFGGGIGLLAAALLTLLIARHWVADFLENAVTLMLVLTAFAIANEVQHESGLLTVTVMGFALANQKWADMSHILEFKENLVILLLSMVFIILAACLTPQDLIANFTSGMLFVGVLIFLARPLTVFVSTWRSPLTLRERTLMAWMAPRGIVAAAVASVFALKLSHDGEAALLGAELLVPITFLTIIATVVVYGLTSPILARLLKVAESDPQGVLLVGADDWSREVALVLQREGFRTLLVDSNREHIADARMAGLPTYSGSILAEHTLDLLELGGVGRLLAVTPNDWVNVLTVRRFARILGKRNCYQLPPQQDAKRKQRHKYLHGRWLFGEDTTHSKLTRRMDREFVVKASRISEQFGFGDFRDMYGKTAIPLFVIDSKRKLRIIAADSPAEPEPGDTLISLVKEKSAPVQGGR